MAYKAEILADSTTRFGKRLTTFHISLPRIVLPEFNTHRVFSRNFSSSRAIPVWKTIEAVKNDPFIPVYWGKNRPGMSATEEISEDQTADAIENWLEARDEAITNVIYLTEELGVHKQIANRLLEPWMWATGIVSATEFQNFFNLRCSPDAQPEIKVLADMMKAKYDTSTQKVLGANEWHLPMIDDDERSQLDGTQAIKVAVGRLARVSYNTHEGKRDFQADMDLFDRLLKSRHLSPFEHVAKPGIRGEWAGNFSGWVQLRKTIPGEDGRNSTL